MKVKCILPILFVFFLFVSCTDEDDDLVIPTTNQMEINNSTISGKWYMKGGTINGGAFENYVHDCPTNRDYQNFDLNGEIDFVGFDSSCANTGIETGLWSLSGNILTVNNLPGATIPYSYVYEILSLSSEELVLKQTYNDPSGQVVAVSHFTRN